MLKLPTDILQPDMILAKSITDDRGRTLLRQGMSLTDDYILVLQQRNIPNVFVQTQDTRDLTVDSLLPNEIQSQAQNAVACIFDFVKGIATEFSENSKDLEKAATEDKNVVDTLRASPDFVQLENTAVSIAQNMLDKKTLAGLSQIRSQSQHQYNHAVNVATTAILLGKTIHLSSKDVERLGAACLLHDIGKVFFNPNLFQSNGQPPVISNPLKLQEHTRLGYELLRSRNPSDVKVNHVALAHHERQDGQGYPRGLRGTNRVERQHVERDSILLITEIASVADVYDILGNNTPQRPALSPKQIATTMRQLSGTFLNAELVDIFLSLLPVLPVGINVVVRTGRYVNYKGVVTQVNKKNPDRPTIRLIYSPHGQQITPINLNLASKEDTLVEAIL